MHALWLVLVCVDPEIRAGSLAGSWPGTGLSQHYFFGRFFVQTTRYGPGFLVMPKCDCSQLHKRTLLGESSADLKHWLLSVEQLRGSATPLPVCYAACQLQLPNCQRRYASMFKDAEWTGEQLLCIDCDAPLEDLGMSVETDRKYLLLQLSRVRDRQKIARVSLGLLPSLQSILCHPTYC